MKPNNPDVVVIGAGSFGGWSALRLQEAGLKTLLIEAWGAGHVRSSSGGESRIIRCGYAERAFYSRWAWEAGQEWRRRQADWDSELLVPTGVLWLGTHEDAFLNSNQRVFGELGIPFQELEAGDIRQRFPWFRVGDHLRGLFEPDGGALMAKRACRRVVRAFTEAGGSFRLGRVEAPAGDGASSLDRIRVGGSVVEAPLFVFACGPWLAGLFPGLLSERIRPTRQEVFFFGLPAGHPALDPGAMPVWIEFERDDFYGLPPLDGRGIKVASDRDGPGFDPDLGDRSASAEGMRQARDYLSSRFPEFSAAPLLESRVCQYEKTPDRHLIVDRHPDWENVFIAGGGSGHGFKLGPMVGKTVSELLQGRPAPAEVRLTK